MRRSPANVSIRVNFMSCMYMMGCLEQGRSLGWNELAPRFPIYIVAQGLKVANLEFYVAIVDATGVDTGGPGQG